MRSKYFRTILLLHATFVYFQWQLCGAIPIPNQAEHNEMDNLFEHSLSDLKTLSTSSQMWNPYDSESFVALTRFGTKLLPYVIEKNALRDVTMDGSTSIAYDRLLNSLWRDGLGSWYLTPSVPWCTEPFVNTWKGGRHLANARTSFILAEWRYARQTGHIADERLASQTIRYMGILAFEVLFSELEEGSSDILELFPVLDVQNKFWTSIDRESLLDWWDENRENLELPETQPDFPISLLKLEEWKRLGF